MRMEHATVVQLPQFRSEASLAGCTPETLARISKHIEEHPYFGHRLIAFHDPRLDIPLGGFYVRSWKHVTATGHRSEGCTIHLYLGQYIPVYLYNFSSCYEHEVPWATEKSQANLLLSAWGVCLGYNLTGD